MLSGRSGCCRPDWRIILRISHAQGKQITVPYRMRLRRFNDVGNQLSVPPSKTSLSKNILKDIDIAIYPEMSCPTTDLDCLQVKHKAPAASLGDTWPCPACEASRSSDERQI